MPKQSRRKRMQRTRPANRRGRGDPDHFPLTRVPRSSAKDSPTPPERDTTLHFYVNFVLTNTGQTYAAVRFYTNAAFSPDIVTPSNKPNGFAAYANLYGSYRVIAYDYEIDVITRELFGFTCMVRNTNTDPGTGSGQLAYVGESNSTSKVVPAAGAPPVKFRGSHTIAAIAGRPVENDDILAADVTTIPSDVLFLGIFLQAQTELFTASTGANVSLHIRLRTRFFNRKLINDSVGRPPHPYIVDTGIEAAKEQARRVLEKAE